MKRVPLYALIAVAFGSFGLIGCGAETEASEQQEEEIADLAQRGVGGAPEVEEQQQTAGN